MSQTRQQQRLPTEPSQRCACDDSTARARTGVQQYVINRSINARCDIKKTLPEANCDIVVVHNTMTLSQFIAEIFSRHVTHDGRLRQAEFISEPLQNGSTSATRNCRQLYTELFSQAPDIFCANIKKHMPCAATILTRTT